MIDTIALLVPSCYMMKSSALNFLWGYGITNNLFEYEKYIGFFNIKEDVQSPHNFIVSLVLMFGVIFTAVFMFVAIKNVWYGLKNLKLLSNSSNKAFLLFFPTIIISMMLQGLFDSSLVYTHFFNFQFFLIYLGILRLINKDRNYDSLNSVSF